MVSVLVLVLVLGLVLLSLMFKSLELHSLFNLIGLDLLGILVLCNDCDVHGWVIRLQFVLSHNFLKN